MVEQTVEDRIVARKRNPLVVVVVVVHVVGRPHRHALDDRGVDLLRRPAPLLRGVAAEERVEERRLVRLIRHERGKLGGGELHTEELVHEREAKRQEVGLAAVARQHLVLVAVELHKPPHEPPHVVKVRMEDVASVHMHLDAARRVGLAPHIAAHCRAPFEHEHLAAFLGQAPCDGRSPDARTRHYNVNTLHDP